ANGDELDRVPLTGRFFVVGVLDDARPAAVLARHGELGAALLVDHRAFAILALAFDVNDPDGDGPVIAAILLLDLQLLRAHPEGAGGAVLADAVVEQSAIAHGFLARRPALLAPLELERQVIILVLVLGRQRAEDLARDADGRFAVRLNHGVDVLRVLVEADDFFLAVGAAQPGVPALEILAVEENRPAVFAVVAGRRRAARRQREQSRQTQHMMRSHGNSFL